ncbi:unnamed protein product [Durusdinium trenchii]|uniref:Queuosine salvage protein n=1 Tax=Durusdinium trenchii TaxID=1381693 RepID=A0ABP0LEQ1_9DINO
MHDFTVGLVDGQSKLLLMLSIVAFVDELEISEDAINQCPMLLKTFESFRYIRCAYQHFENAAGHYLNSLLRAPIHLVELVHQHYDLYKHEESGLPISVLSLDFWVPGCWTRKENPKFKGKGQFETILTTTETTAVLYATRATQDRRCAFHCVPGESRQKMAQLSEDEHIHLHDICCLWVWLRAELEGAFPSNMVDKYTDLFYKG